MEKRLSVSTFYRRQGCCLCIYRPQNTLTGKASQQLSLEDKSKVGFVVRNEKHRKTMYAQNEFLISFRYHFLD